MPTITVHALAGRDLAKKRELARRLTDAIVEIYGVPAENVTVRFEESALENFAKAGLLAIDSKEIRAKAGLDDGAQ